VNDALVLEACYLIMLSDEEQLLYRLDYWLEQWLDRKNSCPICGEAAE